MIVTVQINEEELETALKVSKKNLSETQRKRLKDKLEMLLSVSAEDELFNTLYERSTSDLIHLAFI